MTVLIITFDIPQTVENITEQEFLKVLFRQGRNLAAFDISFLVIGVYWVKNLEYYSLIAKVDIPFVWMKLIYSFSSCSYLLPICFSCYFQKA